MAAAALTATRRLEQAAPALVAPAPEEEAPADVVDTSACCVMRNGRQFAFNRLYMLMEGSEKAEAIFFVFKAGYKTVTMSDTFIHFESVSTLPARIPARPFLSAKEGAIRAALIVGEMSEAVAKAITGIVKLYMDTVPEIYQSFKEEHGLTNPATLTDTFTTLVTSRGSDSTWGWHHAARANDLAVEGGLTKQRAPRPGEPLDPSKAEKG
jgi:hypothetical protein